MTKTEKLLNTLKSGKEMTAKQVAKVGFANPHDAIYRLRNQGYSIYTNKRTFKGAQVNMYRLGTPRQA